MAGLILANVPRHHLLKSQRPLAVKDIRVFQSRTGTVGESRTIYRLKLCCKTDLLQALCYNTDELSAETNDLNPKREQRMTVTTQTDCIDNKTPYESQFIKISAKTQI
jgi:hypothetical protein